MPKYYNLQKKKKRLYILYKTKPSTFQPIFTWFCPLSTSFFRVPTEFHIRLRYQVFNISPYWHWCFVSIWSLTILLSDAPVYLDILYMQVLILPLLFLPPFFHLFFPSTHTSLSLLSFFSFLYNLTSCRCNQKWVHKESIILYTSSEHNIF